MHRTRTATSTLSSRDRFGDGFIKCVARFHRGQLSEPGLEVDHDVVGDPLWIHPPVAFPDQAAGAVSLHRSAHPGGSGNSNAPGPMRGNDGGTEEGGGTATSGLQDGAELIALAYPPVAAEMGVTGGHVGQWVARASGSYAPRRCRPLARRLLMTSLPPRDLMRTRKPCVLLLRRLLGWNVLFTVFLESLPKVRTCDVIGY